MKPRQIDFNAHHSPVGAFASFTLGHFGQKGGFGICFPTPGNEHVYVAAETEAGGEFEFLPFTGYIKDDRERYLAEQAQGKNPSRAWVRSFPPENIARDFNVATDSWTAGDLTFTLYSPPREVPDPAKAGSEALKWAVVPAIAAELTLDNTRGSVPRRACFGWCAEFPHASMRVIDESAKGRFVGVGNRTEYAIVSRDRGVYPGQGFGPEEFLKDRNPAKCVNGLGNSAVLIGVVPPGRKRTFRFAICFYHGGTATTRLPCSYYYSRFFRSVEDVAAYALANLPRFLTESRRADRRIERAALSEDQKFMLAHAIRSYFGSTELLRTADGKPFWVANEGEYRLINTFDLTADHLFYELRMNPWAVRNELEWFVRRYSYVDRVRAPGSDKEYPGGIAFTHDMGVANALAPRGYSSYERSGYTGCWSYMSHEELTNWVLCALAYVHRTGDMRWARKYRATFTACLQSMVNRDHYDPAQRDGIMSLDGARCEGGSEITTYDSLDRSLGQARNNLYLAVKCWAAYVGLERLFGELRREADRAAAADQARRCADSVCRNLRPDGYVPAVIGEGVESRIIPAVEGLAFPVEFGLPEAVSPNGPYGELIRCLERHLKTVLQPGVCLFDDGGWKLSSTSDNSWLSKIYLCQFVARKVFGMPWDDAGRRADSAHVDWLLCPESRYWAWSDQMVKGKALASKFYPRGVTAILWLEEQA